MLQMAKYLSRAHGLIHALRLLFFIALLSISGLAVNANAADLSPNPSSRGQADTRVEVRAATRVTWKGGTDSRWSNPANWDNAIVPGPFDIAHLRGSADTQIDAAFSGAVAGIVLEPDFAGTVRLGRDLRVRSNVVIEGGTFVQGDHSLTAVDWMQTNGQFVGGSAPLTIRGAAIVRGGVLVTPSALMRVRSLDLQSPGVVRLGENGKLELTGDGTPLSGEGVLDTTTNLPNSVESTGRATTDLLAAGPLRGYGALGSEKADHQLHPGESAPLSIPAAATGVALQLAAGEDNLRSAVMDPTGTFAYFGTSTNPGIVVKVRLSDLTRVGALRLAAGENDLHAAVIDAAGEFAYFATYTSPGIVVKIRLSDFTRVAALKLNVGENLPRAAVIDTATGLAYFGTFTSPGRIIQVRLSDMTHVRALTLNPGEELLFPAVIDPGAGFAYFGGRTVPGIIVKVRLSDLTRVGRLTMNPGEDSFHTGVIDPAGGYAYFGTYTSTGIVVKVRLADFTRAGALTLNPGEGNLRSSVIDRANGMVYFGTADVPGIVIGVRLSDFARVGALTLDPGQDKLRSAVIDPASRFIYFGTGSSPGIVVKLPTFSDTPMPTPTATPAVSNTPTNTPLPPTPTRTPTPTATLPAGPATNLVVNPGFELDANNDSLPDSWSTWSQFTRSSAVVHSGTFAGRFRAANDSGGQVRQRVRNLTAGTTYNSAGWVNIPATTDAFSLKLQVRWLNSAQNAISTVTMRTYSAATTGWNQTSAALVAPAGTAMADIRLVVSSLNATIYVDDFSFAKAPGQPASHN